MYKIIRTKRSKANAIEIARYYEGCKDGLGEEFFQDYEKRIEKILKQTPKIAQIVYKNRRFLALKKFPHNIVFIINEPKKEVQVVAIIHPKRNIHP